MSIKLSPNLFRDTIDPLAAYHRLTDRGSIVPIWPVLKEIKDGNR
jgi:hypothetical protein